MADKRQDYNGAEAMYQKGLELDPKHADNTCRYAKFLADQRKDYEGAEAMYKKALELDPSDASNTASYANFLANQRGDYDGAVALYKKALELDPSGANNMANCASSLLTRGDDASLTAVLPLVQGVIDLARPEVSQTVAEGLLYGALVEELMASARHGRMLARLKGALLASYPRGDWDFSPMFAAVFPRLAAPRRDLFLALGEAILDAERLPALDAIALWREVEAVDPFAA